jgi:adenylate cyclase class 2
MANNNIEVEIKVPIDEKRFLQLRERLNSEAKFEKSSHQKDEYFNAPDRDFLKPKYPFEWLSIRSRGDKTILSYKHYHPEDVQVATHCDEFETQVGNPEGIRKIFSSLGFRSIVVVEKQRETYNLRDEFEIALDTVDDIGHFVEIEALKDFGGVVKTREKIFELAKSLGIDPKEADKRGYPFLVMEKQGLIR